MAQPNEGPEAVVPAVDVAQHGGPGRLDSEAGLQVKPGKIVGFRHPDPGILSRELPLRLPYIRPPPQQVRRQPGRDPFRRRRNRRNRIQFLSQRIRLPPQKYPQRIDRLDDLPAQKRQFGLGRRRLGYRPRDIKFCREPYPLALP